MLENKNLVLENTTDVQSVEVRTVIIEDLKFAENVSGRWLTVEYFLGLERQAGKYEYR